MGNLIEIKILKNSRVPLTRKTISRQVYRINDNLLVKYVHALIIYKARFYLEITRFILNVQLRKTAAFQNRNNTP
jgi:hypothetical protein